MISRLEIAVLAGVMLLAGCAGTRIGLHTGSAPPPGSSYSSSAIQAEVGSNAFFSLLFLGYIAAGVQDDRLGWRNGPIGRAPPQLAEDRAIAERDCSLPMAAPSANLRCK